MSLVHPSCALQAHQSLGLGELGLVQYMLLDHICNNPPGVSFGTKISSRLEYVSAWHTSGATLMHYNELLALSCLVYHWCVEYFGTSSQ